MSAATLASEVEDLRSKMNAVVAARDSWAAVGHSVVGNVDETRAYARAIRDIDNALGGTGNGRG